jgi:hypothetical protein
MHIVFEEHQYKAADVLDVLKEITSLEDVDKKISVSYVGYFYNSAIKDCVFILPKVLLTDIKITSEDGKEQSIEIVANVPSKDGRDYITPEDIITPAGQEAWLPKEYRKFLYEFSVWVYRALNVYRKQNPTSKAIYYKKLPQEGRGRKKHAETYLDIVLSLIRFNRENQNFFLTIVKNIHKGNNKINWTKTISKTSSIIQDNEVMYLNPVNKKRMQNFDEELFVIFFSILNFLNETYGFRSPINLQYDLIKSKQFKNYLNGRGKQRLKQIRYKYFSDKAMQLWDICYAFFDTAYKLNINAEQKEYLLAKKFNIVFEAMIDELIGEKDIPKGLKEQDDGKRVDHMYTYYGLTNSNDEKDEIYYIGDSKYYKANHPLGKESIYKQYTYARNVIQWNIDLFVNQDQSGWTDEEKRGYEEDKDKYKSIRLRDDAKDSLTEGYNIIPNFFISAFVDEKRNYIKEKNIVPHEQPQTHITFQFKDRLFDRDTLILSHYDVNFLYVLYLYARNKSSEKDAWKKEVRKIFRDEIRKVLQNKFDFFAMKSKGNVIAGEQFIKDNFKELQGKLLRPYADKTIYTLALEKREGESPQDSKTYKLLKDFFEFEELNNLGDNPKKKLDDKVEQLRAQQAEFMVPKDWLPIYHLERYSNSKVLIGAYHGDDQLKWILDNHLYNIRLGKDRAGAQKESELRAIDAKFLILYEAENEFNNDYTIYKINGKGGRKTNNTMRELKYPREPKGDYYCYDLDEEVYIGQYNLNTIISRARIDRRIVEEGELLIMSCEELKKK